MNTHRNVSGRQVSIFERYLELSVPRTWLYALISFFFGYLISGGRDPLLLVIGVLMFGPVLTGATNLINMYYDTTEDRINKPIRKEHLAVLGNRNVRNAAFLLYILALMMSALFHSMEFSLAIALYIVISYTYSAPPLRFKKRFMVNLFMLAYGSVFLPFLSPWLIDGRISEVPWGIATFSTAVVLFPIAGKDITDPVGDRQAGNATIFTVMDFRDGVRFFSRVMLWVPYIVLLILLFLRLIPDYMLLSLVFIPLTYRDMKAGLSMKDFDVNVSRSYFRRVFWHIIYFLILSFSIPLIYELYLI